MSAQPVVVVASRWRCQDHPDEAVTRRGAGCRVCERPDPPATPELTAPAASPPAVRVTVDTGAPANIVVAFVETTPGEPATRVRYRLGRDRPWSCQLDGDALYPRCEHARAAQDALEAAAARRGLTNGDTR